MASILATQTIVGTIGNVYELRTVGRDNRKVIDFSVAVTRKKKDGDDWKDGETYWLTITAWNTLAENVEKSFKKGDRVIVYGYTDMKPGYTTEDGNKRDPRPILVAEFAGHEVTFASSTQHRTPRPEGGYQGNNNGGGSNQQRSSAPAKKAAPAKKPAVDNDMIFDDLEDFSFDGDDAPPF